MQPQLSPTSKPLTLLCSWLGMLFPLLPRDPSQLHCHFLWKPSLPLEGQPPHPFYIPRPHK